MTPSHLGAPAPPLRYAYLLASHRSTSASFTLGSRDSEVAEDCGKDLLVGKGSHLLCPDSEKDSDQGWAFQKDQVSG